MELPTKLQSLVDSFAKLPGIGGKTALRQALILYSWSEAELEDFAKSVSEISLLKSCESCGLMSDESICNICQDQKRASKKIICVVETMSDFLAIEKSEQFFGQYHILKGVLNPLLGIGPDELNLKTLVDRLNKEPDTEIVLALNPSVEGDATCSYIKEIVPPTVKVNRIGFGVPIGGHLEYLDSMTISKAFENRRSI